MYLPHKKCYEGYEILMGSVRWAVMGRFKREGKKEEDRIQSWPAKISKNKKGVQGWGWGCH